MPILSACSIQNFYSNQDKIDDIYYSPKNKILLENPKEEIYNSKLLERDFYSYSLNQYLRDSDGDGIYDFSDPLPYIYGPYIDMNNNGVIDIFDLMIRTPVDNLWYYREINNVHSFWYRKKIKNFDYKPINRNIIPIKKMEHQGPIKRRSNTRSIPSKNVPRIEDRNGKEIKNNQSNTRIIEQNRRRPEAVQVRVKSPQENQGSNNNSNSPQVIHQKRR